jgi:hypothetical protein
MLIKSKLGQCSLRGFPIETHILNWVLFLRKKLGNMNIVLKNSGASALYMSRRLAIKAFSSFVPSVFCSDKYCRSRSQWSYELSLLARTLRSWVQIPFEAWKSVCVYSVCFVLYVGSGLATGWSPVQGVLPTVYRITKLKKRPGPNQGL